MPDTAYNHGVRIFDAGETPRPLEMANLTTIGALITAPDANPDKWPLDEPVHLYSNDSDMLEALAATGTGRDVFDSITDQGIVASVVAVRVAEGATEDETLSAMVGSSASLTGVHALKAALSHVGVEPGLIIAPGYTVQRPGDAGNPVVAECLGVADRLRAVMVADAPPTSREAALQWRQDWTSERLYCLSPGARVWPAGATAPVDQPLSARAAALFCKRDKENSVFHSPSNQTVRGIVGPTRPITFYEGDTDHEANYLNSNRIATLLPNRILWGNETCSDDPLWRFVSMRRGRDAIHKTILKSFRWAMDKNMGSHLAVAVIQSVQEFLDKLKGSGAILGGRAFWVREINSNESLRSGILRVEFDAEEAPPLQDLQFGSRRNAVYFDVMANDIMNALERNSL